MQICCVAVMPPPALPVTPKAWIVKLKGGVSVVLDDADPKAIVFYTIDGSTPTPCGRCGMRGRLW